MYVCIYIYIYIRSAALLVPVVLHSLHLDSEDEILVELEAIIIIIIIMFSSSSSSSSRRRRRRKRSSSSSRSSSRRSSSSIIICIITIIIIICIIIIIIIIKTIINIIYSRPGPGGRGAKGPKRGTPSRLRILGGCEQVRIDASKSTRGNSDPEGAAALRTMQP